MAHHYGHPISVTLAPNGQPASFRWRDCFYPISEVFATWHRKDRWSEQPQAGNLARATYSRSRGASDRIYYRVCCSGPAGEQIFDLYHEGITNLWVLDVAHD
jgi:hypothetical protein